MFYRLQRMLLDAQGGEGGSPTTAADDQGKAPDLVKAVESLVAKHGDSTAALRVLLGENYQLRDSNRELKAKIPGDGAIVLQGDSVKDWNAYQALGKPDDLKRVKGEHATFAAEVSGYKRREHHAEIAKVATIDGKPVNPKVLGTLAGDLEFFAKPAKGKDGKEAPAAFVRHKDADGKDVESAFEDFARSHWADFLPSLAPGESRPDAARGTPRQPAASRESSQGEAHAPAAARKPLTFV